VGRRPIHAEVDISTYTLLLLRDFGLSPKPKFLGPKS